MINTVSVQLEKHRHAAKVDSHKITRKPLISKLPKWEEYSSKIDMVFDANGEKIDASIGVVEILECLAYLLEERYLVAKEELPSVPNMAPYQLVSKLARHISPNMTRDNIIRMCICSLQSADPALSLYYYMGVCRGGSDSQIAKYLEVASFRSIIDNIFKMLKMFNMVGGMFEKDEPMALSVHRVLSLMETYLVRRIKHPFFELELLDDINKYDQELQPKYLTAMLVKSGVCRMYLTRTGDPDQLSRDDIAAVKYNKKKYAELAFGENKMHASFHYVMLHLDGKSFRTEESLAELKPEARICPFYSACAYELRKVNPAICKSTPWRSLSLDASVKESCWYREGVRATRRPDDE